MHKHLDRKRVQGTNNVVGQVGREELDGNEQAMSIAHCLGDILGTGRDDAVHG